MVSYEWLKSLVCLYPCNITDVEILSCFMYFPTAHSKRVCWEKYKDIPCRFNKVPTASKISLSWYTEVIQGKSQFRDPGYLAGNRIASITDTISLFHNPSIEMLHCKIQESIGMAWYNNMTVLLDSINLQGYKSQQKMSKVISTGLRR